MANRPSDTLRAQISGLSTRGILSEEAQTALAEKNGLSPLAVQQAACAAGCMPARYQRNAASFSTEQQGVLLRSHVLLAGLGGLGGFVLEQLARLGTGYITGVDGDLFEASNLNRQLLACQSSLGRPKALAAQQRVADINPAACFCPVQEMVDKTRLVALLQGMDAAIDAFGGRKSKLLMLDAALEAGVPLVVAGIAGTTGWCGIVRSPQDKSASFLRSADKATEQAGAVMGNLVQVACLAAGMQVTLALDILLGKPFDDSITYFDTRDLTFVRIKS